MATIQGIDTFAHQVASTAGGLYDATFGTPTFDTVTVFGSDPCSLLIDASTPEAVRHNFTGSPNKVFSAFRFRISSIPTNGQNCIFRLSNGTNNLSLFLETSGKTSMTIGAGTNVLGSTVLSAATWYWFEIIFDLSANPWQATWRINGAAAEGTASLAVAASTASYTQVGEPGIFTPSGWRYSCWLWGTATGLTDWPGEYIARAVSPASVGTHNLDAATSTFFFKNAGANVAITSTETDSYTYIDDVPLSAGTDYDTITGNTPTNTWYIEHKYTPLSASAGPSAVRCIDTIRNVSGTTANVIGSKVTDDGGVSLTNIYSALSVGSASNLYKAVTMATKPSGGAWTAAALDALRHRWGYSSAANPAIEIQSALLEAIFPVGTTFGGHNLTIGLPVETDTAFAVTAKKTKAVGLTTETDTTFSITAKKTKTVGLPLETDTAFSVSKSKTKAVGLPTETDTAFAVSVLKTLSVGIATETDTAFSVTIVGGGAAFSFIQHVNIDTPSNPSSHSHTQLSASSHSKDTLSVSSHNKDSVSGTQHSHDSLTATKHDPRTS